MVCDIRRDMRSSALTVLANVLAALAAKDSCTQLRDEWPRRLVSRLNREILPIPNRTVSWHGRGVKVQVWGGGGAERAAAAALFVVLHHLLGYEARLQPVPVDLCRLAADDSPAAVAPAAAWPAGHCNETWILDDLMSPSTGAALPFTPLLLAASPDATCVVRATSWHFFLDADASRACGFLPPADPTNATDRSAVGYEVLARNESERDALALAALCDRGRSLPLDVRTFDSDFLLRREISAYRGKRRAFLFFDDDIWCEDPLVVRVLLPPARSDARPRGAVRVGAGRFMRSYAPSVAFVVEHLSLSGTELRTILDLEAQGARPDIVNATCSWVRNAMDKLMDSLLRKDPFSSAYSIAIYVCELNPDVEDAMAIVSEGLQEAIGGRYRFDLHRTNCSDADALRIQLQQRAQDRTAMGAVAWSQHAGVRAAAADAPLVRLPLLLVGPATGSALSPLVRAASGRVEDLARAYRHLLGLCGWSRLALLSDGSAFAASFAAALFAGREYVHQLETVDSRNVSVALSELRAADARVILVNAPWNLSAAVVCAGQRLGMRADAGYAWLARDWHGGCDARVLSLGLEWRGAGAVAGSRWQAALRARWALRGASASSSGDTIVPSNAASLVDALLQLVHGFENFLKDFPNDRYDLRGSALNITRSFDRTTVPGVAHSLTSESHALKNPTVYVELWIGDHGAVVGVWRVARGVLEDDGRTRGAACAELLGAEPVADRRACLTARSGPMFTPRCHDAAVGAGAALALAAAAALLAARRARRRRLLRRDLALAAALLERRRRTAATLVTYLVDRDAVRLLHVIGSGSYGRVHFAELRRPAGAPLLVAAKEPREGAAPAEEDEFLREACVLAPLAHANVVRLVGVCVADGPPMVLMEHALHLDLRRYLVERRPPAGACMELSPEALTRLAREAAGALEYLAGRRLVHRDVRAANCLVDKERSLKLADFGLARELGAAEPEYATTRRGLFPVLWMAPESLEHGIFSPASDVWALGVLMLELATLGARPFGGWPAPRVLHYVVTGGHPPLPADLSEHTRALLLQCWRRPLEARPSAASVQRQLLATPRAVRATRMPPPVEPATQDGSLCPV